jgi:hypothetical protein
MCSRGPTAQLWSHSSPQRRRLPVIANLGWDNFRGVSCESAAVDGGAEAGHLEEYDSNPWGSKGAVLRRHRLTHTAIAVVLLQAELRSELRVFTSAR